METYHQIQLRTRKRNAPWRTIPKPYILVGDAIDRMVYLESEDKKNQYNYRVIRVTEEVVA